MLLLWKEEDEIEKKPAFLIFVALICDVCACTFVHLCIYVSVCVCVIEKTID